MSNRLMRFFIHSRPQNHGLKTVDKQWPLSISPKEPRVSARVGSILGLSVLLISSFAYADEVGRFAAVEGRVDILMPKDAQVRTVREGDVVSSGDIIRTKSLSKAEIRFTDKTVLKLAQNTRVEIADYTLNDFNLRANGVINLERGEIRAIVSKTIGSTNFFVNTPNASGSVKGTDLFVFFQKSSTGVLVNKGNFSLVNNEFLDQSIDVSGGFTSVVPPGQPPQEPRPYLDVEKSRHEVQTSIIRPQAAEDPSHIRALVVKISGEVKVRRDGARKWQALMINDVLDRGDEIETKESGKVELRLDNGNIITLKPNSTIIFKKLMWDLNTGDYENLFEANFGNLRAKVEKLKRHSKFEIKTPTAVAAVRGTTMYLGILPALTTAFYEDGSGTLTSVISNVSKVVGDGQTSSADDQGNVSDSVDATDEQKSQWQAGWDPGETQGYSPPGEGGDGPIDYDGGGGGGGGAPDMPDTVDGTPVDVPPEPEADGTTGGGVENNLTGASEGEYFTSLERDIGSFIQATITSTDTSLSSPPDAEDPAGFAQATISGTYSNPNNSSIWLGNVRGGDSTGGAYEGWMAGTWLSWEGMLNGLYIDSTGNAGLVGGDFSGTNTEATFTGEGELNYQPIRETTIPAGQLSDSIVDRDPAPGRFWSILGDSEGEPGFIIGEEDRTRKNITGEPWGIYSNIYDARYYNPEGDTDFTGVLQGYNDEGLFVSLLMGVDNSNGAIEMNLVGPYLTYDKEQIYTGGFLGAYSEGNSYDLEAVELGVFLEGEREEPFAFIGFWGQDIETINGASVPPVGSLYHNSSGDISWAGEEVGVIGGGTSPWEGEAVLSGLGYYYVWESEPYIWNTPIYSYNPEEGNYTTRDGGAFWGYTGGLWSDEAMDGSLVALYLAPTGTEGIYDAGFLTGDVEGEYYPGISMWEARGTLAPTPMTRDESLDINTEYLEDFIDWGGLEAEVEGFFGDWDGEIEGWSEWGETAFIYDGEDSLPWGIYDIKFAGPDSYENPYSDTTWFTFIEGEGEFGYEEGEWIGGMGGIWLDGKIRGSLSGLYMTEEYNVGLINGDVFGLYDELEDYYGTWVGESIGTFTHMGTTYYRPDIYDFDFYGEAIAIFGEGGSLEDVSIEGIALEFSDEDWGVWAAAFESEYNNPAGLEHWTGEMAAYFDDELLFIGSVEGTDSIDEQILRLDMLLYAFDSFYYPESLMTFSGTAFGTYEPFDSFYYEGVGTGSFIEDPLTFSGIWGEEDFGEEDFSLYFNEDGVISWAGEDYGVIGSTSTSWWLDSSPFVAMGEYWSNVDGDVPLLWNTPIYSFNFDEWEYYTYDGGAFFGYTGGIWRDLTLDGTVVAIYLDPDGNAGLLTGDARGYYFPFFDETWFATGTLTPTLMAKAEDLGIDYENLEYYLYEGGMDGELEGAFLDYVMNGDREGFDWGVQGLIDGWSDWGETAFIYDGEESQPWGIYDLKLMGPDSYDKPVDSSNLWIAFVDGEGEFGYPGDGWYLGMAGGIWQDGGIYGALRALYVIDETLDMASAGLIKGDIFGIYDEAGVDYGTWIGESIGIFTEMDTSEYYTGFNGLEFYGTGLGSFEGGGILEDVFCYGFSLSLLDQDWGIWSAITEGNWTGPTSPWQLALGGAPYDDSDYIESWPIVWFGTVNGEEWEDQKLFGDFRGFWFTSIEEGDGNVLAGKITGEVIGTYIDVPDGTDTWQSIGVGEWVEVTDLLAEGEGNLGFEMEELQDFVSVPITETYANLLTGAGGFDAGGAMQAIMDLSIYNNEIWAALISGTYSGPTGDSWNLQLSDGPDVTNLSGDLWSQGEWHAAVDGVVNDMSIAGEAAGTYNDGTFEGLGAGTVE